jgi:hypothetical protein
MDMEEWRLCVFDFETYGKIWTEEFIPANNITNVFSHHEIITINALILKIKCFIRNKNQSQQPETLYELHKMIHDLKILLTILAVKYCSILFLRFLAILKILKFSITFLAEILLFYFF